MNIQDLNQTNHFGMGQINMWQVNEIPHPSTVHISLNSIKINSGLSSNSQSGKKINQK